VQARTVLERLDQNTDGKISRSEARKDPAIWEDFARIDQSDPAGGDQQWGRDEITRWCRTSRAGEVSLGQLWELASKALRMLPGETRLIGWTAEEFPGVVIRPIAAQEVRRTIVLVHLKPGNWLPPLRDINLLTDVAEIKPENLEEQDPVSQPTVTPISPQPVVTPPAAPPVPAPSLKSP
jgi:hypothetical protein